MGAGYGIRDTGYWILGAGNGMPDAGKQASFSDKRVD
jgi:hypothetical protein